MSETIEVEPKSEALAIRPKWNGAVAPRDNQNDYAGLMAMAKELCTTGFLPAAVKTPAQAVAIILTGRELGLGPMQSLRSICIIQGKPELAADLQLSIFHRDGGRSKWLALTDQKAVLWLRHPNGDEHTESFTMEDARRAGLANGQNWLKYPKAMLRSRAITAGLKSTGFEPLAGAYAPGEIGGPEIVGPEPETVPEVATPELVAAGVVATPKPATPPAASGTAQWTQTPGFIWNWVVKEKIKDRRIATEYFRKLENPAVLMPNEELQDLGAQWIPLNGAQLTGLLNAIKAFENGESAKHPFTPNPVLAPTPKPPVQSLSTPIDEPDPQKRPPPHLEKAKQDPEWWRGVIVPVPNKGQKKVEYMRDPDTIGSLYDQCKQGNEPSCKRLYGFVGHFEAKPWVGMDGKSRPPSATDITFREALDAFAAWHKENGNDSPAEASGPPDQVEEEERSAIDQL